MKKNKFTKYLIIAALMLAQTAPVTFADSDKSGFKFPTTITTAPIGSAETIGSLEINGRYRMASISGYRGEPSASRARLTTLPTTNMSGLMASWSAP